MYPYFLTLPFKGKKKEQTNGGLTKVFLVFNPYQIVHYFKALVPLDQNLQLLFHSSKVIALAVIFFVEVHKHFGSPFRWEQRKPIMRTIGSICVVFITFKM